MQKIVHAAAIIVILAGAGAGAAQAQERSYIGLALGPSKGSIKNGDGQRVRQDNDVVAFKGYAGYALNRHFAIEAGHAGTTGMLRFDGARFGAQDFHVTAVKPMLGVGSPGACPSRWR
ncbi:MULTISPECIES: hypothetical protein [Massilia]|uniref:Outer membrane protein beta-barrel domain-containing protein n=1 Tax=Massilia aurea TaxID=373040 RepID=A0A422QNG7_9BURK|nr:MULTISPECIES: hypothetical protein [Massilia]MDY0964431.1 hypothetical protein [Massilia sp. CFBP9026]RNF31560.1 hypothetical protein NM04_06480 [Massilia aurea]